MQSTGRVTKHFSAHARMPRQGRLDTALHENLGTVIKKQAKEAVSVTLSCRVVRIAWV
jgi:hypothetical protein